MLLYPEGEAHQMDTEESADEEFKSYVREKRTKATDDPLMWWKYNGELRYPKLARAARHILSTPSTSTASERIFSKAGFIANKMRCSLLPKNVDLLVFLAHNLKQFDPEEKHEIDD